MPSKTQKKEIRKLLMKLDPESKDALLMEGIQEDIAEIKYPNQNDYSIYLLALRADIQTTKDDILNKLNELPTNASLEDLKKKYIEAVDVLEGSFQSLISEVERGSKEDSKKIRGEIKTLEALLEGMRLRVIEVGSRGGGAMNRQTLVEGVDVLKRYTDINLKGSGVTITASNDDANRRVNITFTSSGGGSGYQVPTSGLVNGVNQTYIWATAPNVIVVDGSQVLNKTASDGSSNWTGTLTTVLQNTTPTSNIFACA